MNDSTSNPPLKKCTKCPQEHPATRQYFYSDSSKPTGLSSVCKVCADAQKQSWRARNPDKVLAQSKRERDGYSDEERERRRAYGREYSLNFYHAHKDECSAKYKAYYRRRIDYHLARGKKYKQEHPDKTREWDKQRYGRPTFKAKQQRRRARKQELPDSFTAQDWQHALDHFGGKCAVCGNPPGLWHVIAADHWIPLASPDCPGTVVSNMIPLCHSKTDGQGGCNNEKHHRTPEQWLTEKYGARKGKAVLKRINEYLEGVAI